MPTCGLLYRPFRDGPCALLSFWVPDDDGVSGSYLSIPSDILPEVVYDSFVAAQLEWMQMKSFATAAEIRSEIEKNR